jgi:transposase
MFCPISTESKFALKYPNNFCIDALIGNDNFSLLKLVHNLRIENEELKLKFNGYKAEACYWKAQHGRAIKREAEIKKENEELTAKLRLREQQLFGRKTEKRKAKTESKQESSQRPRGHQKGSPNHGRINHNHLPCQTEMIDLCDADKKCDICGLPYEELEITEDSSIIELIDVRAHKRKIRRKMYKTKCNCKSGKIITAQCAPKLIPKGIIGISLWCKILVEKYHYQRPLHRLLKALKDQGLDLAQGTITGGLKKILPFFVPVYTAIQNKCLEDKRWHADESRWSVFEETEGKVGYRWYLWVFKSTQAVIFKIASSRSASVAKCFFEKTKGGILSVDRYIAYKVIAKLNLLILAFCWAHVRRDFLSHAKEYPQQESWAFGWVELINELYHINNQRVRHEEKASAFLELDKELREKIQHIEDRFLLELKDKSLHVRSKKLLESLQNHWDGLTVFVAHPEVPMDNNVAERQLRNSIIGRKNYYGSGSIWSSELSAMLFSIFETLKLWGISPNGWLKFYLQSCAENHGKPFADIEAFLPWNMSEAQKTQVNQHWNTS